MTFVHSESSPEIKFVQEAPELVYVSPHNIYITLLCNNIGIHITYNVMCFSMYNSVKLGNKDLRFKISPQAAHL